MQFALYQAPANTLTTDCLIVPLFEQDALEGAAQTIDNASDGLLQRLIKRGDITGKSGQTLLIPELNSDQVKATRLLLVGAGKPEAFSADKFKTLHTTALNALKTLKNLNNVVFASLELPVKNKHNSDLLSLALQAVSNQYYEIDTLKSKREDKVAPPEQFGFIVESNNYSDSDLDRADALCAGMSLTKDLANAPGNLCTPTHLAETATKLAQEYSSIKTQIIDEQEASELGLNSFLAVGQGSIEPSKFIIMQYQGAKDAKQTPIGLVGKGISFDSGGVSIKPSEGMEGMKYDMSGAAAVFGVIKAAAAMKLEQNIVAIVASAENMPDGKALKPGDIITSYSGQTIEVINTDAEGRLVLCDALSYIQKHFNPRAIIDVATLTGACVVALGEHNTGLLSNNDELAQKLIDAGLSACDTAWRLPLGDGYQKQIDSPFADIANTGGRAAGTITAACFLSRFIKNDTPWAHLDIAGSAGGVFDKKKGATARPVPLLINYLLKDKT